MRILTLNSSLNDLNELAALAYEIEEGPGSHHVLDRAVAALKRANPHLALGNEAIERGMTVWVPQVPGLKPSAKTEPAAGAHAAKIDSLLKVIDSYEASAKGASTSRVESNALRSKALRSEEFATEIRPAVPEPRPVIENIERKMAADNVKVDKRDKQVSKALKRMRQDLQTMRKRVS